MFRRGGSKIGFFLLILFTLIVSFTNTWKFVNDFLPTDPPWLRPGAFVFFEGGLILWAQYLKHDSENIYRTLIAGVMTVVSLLAVLTATGYEVALDVHSLGFKLDPTITAWVPLSILLVMLGQTLALVLHHFADEKFFARIKHLDETGKTPPQIVTGHLVPQQIPAQSQTVVYPVAASKPRLRQRLGALIAGEQSPANQQQIAAPGQPSISSDLANYEPEESGVTATPLSPNGHQ